MSWPRVLLVTVLTMSAVPGVDAQARDQAGDTHPWRGESGRYTVIDFAASWCGPCWQALPRVQALADQHPEITVLVVSVDDEVAGRDRLVRDLALRVPVLWDEGHEIAEHYQPPAMPTTYLVAPDGTVVDSHAGSSEAGWHAFVANVEAVATGKETAHAIEGAPADDGPLVTIERPR